MTGLGLRSAHVEHGTGRQGASSINNNSDTRLLATPDAVKRSPPDAAWRTLGARERAETRAPGGCASPTMTGSSRSNALKIAPNSALPRDTVRMAHQRQGRHAVQAGIQGRPTCNNGLHMHDSNTEYEPQATQQPVLPAVRCEDMGPDNATPALVLLYGLVAILMTWSATRPWRQTAAKRSHGAPAARLGAAVDACHSTHVGLSNLQVMPARGMTRSSSARLHDQRHR